MKLNLKAAVAALGIFACVLCRADESAPFRLHIYHIGDSHSYVLPSKLIASFGEENYQLSVGGMNAIWYFMNKHESEYPNALRLHSGDFMTGNGLFFDKYKGSSDIRIMQDLGFDAVVGGNHEFDFGDQFLHDVLALKTAEKPHYLMANAYFPKGSPLDGIFEPYHVYEFGDQKIGIIGVISKYKLTNSSNPDKRDKFMDEVETINRYADELRSKGINKILVMSHAGLSLDKDMASKLRGVSAIIGGDSHSIMGEGLAKYRFPIQGPYPLKTQNAEGELLCIVHAASQTLILGDLSLTFDGGRLLDCEGVPRLIVSDILDGYGNVPIPEKLAAVKNELLADPYFSFYDLTEGSSRAVNAVIDGIRADDRLAGISKNMLCQTRLPTEECELNGIRQTYGCEICQSFSKLWSESNGGAIMILNSGMFRSNLFAGKLFASDIKNVIPFGGELRIYQMSGKEIGDAINGLLGELASAKYRSTGGFPTGYGLRFDLRMFAKSRHYASNIEVLENGTWKRLEPNKTYRVMTNGYISSGKDGYKNLGKILLSKKKTVVTEDMTAYTLELMKTMQLEKIPAEDMILKSVKEQ